MKTVFQNLKGRGLVVKLSLFILIATTLIVAASVNYDYRRSSRLMPHNVEAGAGNPALATVDVNENTG